MLKALYDKSCLVNCVGNSLEMDFEHINVSVPQKLTELHIFGCPQLFFTLRLPKLIVKKPCMIKTCLSSVLEIF